MIKDKRIRKGTCDICKEEDKEVNQVTIGGIPKIICDTCLKKKADVWPTWRSKM